MTNTSEKTRAAALAFLEAVAHHFLNTEKQMPEAICDAGIALLEAVHTDEAEAEKMRDAITSITDELELVHFELEDTHQAMRFNLKKNPIVELDS